ncbi:MAG: type II toxin-antitoxin system Phd/YefM family antitoxin [Candidatus Hydrogenedentes bacterium]|nr:type II toxin-antitoxin system Phd/YefM family antitoxin [Candidatus Hydrogenedentota bacterium]
MSKAWQLQEAKNKLSEVVEKAVQEGPQHITKRGKAVAVVLSLKNYERLSGRKESLVEFFRRSPLRGIRLERVKDLPRKVEL